MPPPSVDATIYNSSGDITFQFKSNASLNASGWFCSLICYIPCQTILATLNPFMTIPPPNDSNYIDICIGDSIKFVATGSGPNAFPQAGVLYQQDSTNVTYDWDFGDGTTGIGQTVTKLYNFARGYDIILNVTDIHNCTNINSLGTRVRISRNPFGVVHPVPDLCSSDDTTYVTIGYNSQSVIVIEPIESNQISTQRFDSTMFIPDGGICVPNCYNTNVTFNSFLPGQTITSAADILSVTMDIEHSFAGDLGFTLICPNGTSLVLDPNDHSGGAFLGIPNESDGSPTCAASANPPGTGWVYGWSTVYAQQGSMVSLEVGASPIPATDTINHTNYLTPSNPFSGLIGCPLNGTWNLQICDDWASDNGYIFWWELNLSPNLLPSAWSYSVPIDTTYWSGSFFTVINDSTIRIVPDSGGIFQYTVTVVDAFGCSYDTTLNIEVVKTPDFNLGHDTVFCENQVPYILNAGPGNAYNWSTGAIVDSLSVSTTGQYWVTVTNSNIANTLQCRHADTVSVTVNNIPTSLFTVTTPICPGGYTVVNYTGNGIPSATYTWNFDGGVATPSGGLENYHVSWATQGVHTITLTVTQNNCVSTTTTLTVSTSNLSSVASTTSNASCYGFTDGSATVAPVNGLTPYTYHWNTIPAQNTQNASNLANGNYIVTVTDNGNCITIDTVTITQPTVLVSSLTDINSALCFGASSGSATATAAGGTPSYTYNWSGGTSSGNGVTGLSLGSYTVTVSDSHTCDTVLSFTIGQPPQLTLHLDSLNETCIGACDGKITATVGGGILPYTYHWSTSTSTTNVDNNLCAGSYSLTVTDSNNCSINDQMDIITVNILFANAIVDSVHSAYQLPVIFTSTSNAYSYLWDFGDGHTSNVQNPTNTYDSPGTYSVTLTVNSGPPSNCVDVTTIIITIYIPSTIQIPNIITPNGDGFNDVFKVVSKGLGTEEMNIYNRWGKKVFTWSEVGGTWDGKDGSREYSDGVYFYILKADGAGDGKHYDVHGTVTVLK